MKRALPALVAILFLTAAYLYAWPTATVAYFAAILLHTGGGVILVVALLFALRNIFRSAPPAAKIGWTLILIGGFLGAALIYTGTRRTEWPLLYAHIAACIAGGALLAASWAGQRGFLAGNGRASATLVRCALFLSAAVALAAGANWLRTVPWQRAHRIENPAIAPASMDNEGDGPSGPFFPSSAQTLHHGQIPSTYFMESQSCERCHADIYKQWQSSAHHFSSFNNAWYRSSIEYMQDVVGVKPSKWCAGCHDPALLYSGMFDRPIREIENTPAAQAGLGCMMCHSIAQVKSTMGQGGFRARISGAAQTRGEPESLRPARSRLPYRIESRAPPPSVLEAVHAYADRGILLHVPQGPSRRSGEPLSLDARLQRLRQLAGKRSELAGSAVVLLSREGDGVPRLPHAAREIYRCGRDGGDDSFARFPAANTALPFMNDDAKQLAEPRNSLPTRN